MRRALVAVVVVVFASLPARAATHGPPFQLGSIGQGCDRGTPALSACSVSMGAEPQIGALSAATEVVSPVDGTVPWLGSGGARIALQASQQVPSGRVRIPVIAVVRVHKASAAHTGRLALAGLGGATARVSVHACLESVQLCWQGTGQYVAEAGRTSLSTNERDITIRLDYQLWGDPGSPMPAGRLTAEVQVEVAADLGHCVDCWPASVPDAGRAHATITATVRSIQIDA